MRAVLKKPDAATRTLLLKGGLSLGLKLLSAVVAFLFNLVIARVLIKEDAGLFFLALSVTMVLSTFFRFGMDQSVTRSVAENVADRDWQNVFRCYRVCMLITLYASLLGMVVLLLTKGWICERFFTPELEPVLTIFVWSIFPMSVCLLHSRFFQGAKEMVGLQLYQNLGVSFVFLAILGSVWLATSGTPSLFFCSWLQCFSYLALAGVGAIHWLSTLRRMESESLSVESPEEQNSNIADDVVHPDVTVKWFLAASLPLWGITMIAMLERWFGQLAVGVWCDVADVATFTVALRISMLISIVVMAVNGISFPTFASLHRENKLVELHRTAVMSAWLTFALGLPIAAIVFLFPDFLLGLFGKEFIGSGSLLRILVVGQIAAVASGATGGLLVMTGHQGTALRVSIIAMLFMLVLTVILAPWYGIYGVATANAVGIIAKVVLDISVVRYKLGFWPVGLKLPNKPSAESN
ncbi:MATE family efflux transporter [Stieleria varia]|uniref:Polysaccharide biosynthesis protein n=1 Tax=Stieleria varia TaxID=2528005 RepID=A0A5C6A0I0_9BACT|nr:MATE family efflux transporter [Stieleria varia]TWT92698.1 Polysaccharide biosynthesis protein [Stieleria varia]